MSDEMDPKRPINHLIERARYGLVGVPQVSRERLVEFLNTDEAYQLGVFGAVDWFCNDGDYEYLGDRYSHVFRPILAEYRSDAGYREYLKDPMVYCQGALERWLGNSE